MHAHSIDLRLSAVEPPKITLVKSTGIVEWGKAHSFPARLLELVRNSPTQASITKTRASLVAGEGFTESRSAALNAFVEAKLFVNGKPSRQRFLAALAQDYATFGGYSFQVIRARGGGVAELHYQRFATVAATEMDAEERINSYWLCRDWKDKRRFPPVQIAAYDPEAGGSEPQMYVYQNSAAEQDYYPQPSYFAALNYLETEAELAKYHISNVSSRFSVGTILSLPAPREYTDASGNVVSVEAQQRAFVQGLKDNFAGAEGDRILTLFGDDPEKLAKVQAFADGTPADLFNTYAALCREQILSANRVCSPVIIGLPSGAQLGGAGNEIRTAFQLYFSAVVRPDQLDILAGLRDVLAQVQGIDHTALDELDIWTVLPAETQLLSTPAGQQALDALLQLPMPRANKIARLVTCYGLSTTEAEALVPEDSALQPAPSPATPTLPAAA